MAKLDGLQTVLDFLKGLQPKIDERPRVGERRKGMRE